MILEKDEILSTFIRNGYLKVGWWLLWFWGLSAAGIAEVSSASTEDSQIPRLEDYVLDKVGVFDKEERMVAGRADVEKYA